MKLSELDKLMQGKTIAHIGDVVGFMQLLQIVYSDYGRRAVVFTRFSATQAEMELL